MNQSGRESVPKPGQLGRGWMCAAGTAQPASAACQAANPGNFAGNTAIGNPPLIWHGGAVMGTAETGPIVITPIFWTPADHPMAASYTSLINQSINDVAAAKCNFVYGPVQGPKGQFFNQVINGHN